MKKILVLIAFLGFHECATASDSDASPSYNEGDSLVLELNFPDQTEVKDMMRPLGQETRSGYTGHAQVTIKGVPPISKEILPELLPQLKTPLQAVVKVTKVARECKPSEYNTLFDSNKKCDPNSQFNDEVQFVEWEKDHKDLIDKATAKTDQKIAAEAKAKEKNTKALAALKVRCQPFFDKVIGVRKRLEKKVPQVTQEVVANGVSDKSYLQINKAGDVRVKNDLEDHFNKSTEKEQRELVSLLTNKKYAECPGSTVKGPDHYVEGLEDPRFVDLSTQAN